MWCNGVAGPSPPQHAQGQGWEGHEGFQQLQITPGTAWHCDRLEPSEVLTAKWLGKSGRVKMSHGSQPCLWKEQWLPHKTSQPQPVTNQSRQNCCIRCQPLYLLPCDFRNLLFASCRTQAVREPNVLLWIPAFEALKERRLHKGIHCWDIIRQYSTKFLSFLSYLLVSHSPELFLSACIHICIYMPLC